MQNCSARQEIVLLHPTGLAFNSYETEVLCRSSLRNSPKKKSRKEQYLARKQGKNEDPRNYYTEKLRLWVQAIYTLQLTGTW